MGVCILISRLITLVNGKDKEEESEFIKGSIKEFNGLVDGTKFTDKRGSYKMHAILASKDADKISHLALKY